MRGIFYSSIALILITLFSFSATSASAQGIQQLFGEITPPQAVQSIPGGTPGERIGSLLSRIIYVIYVAAAIVLIFMILTGALQWMTSGGDKEAVSKARARIVHAIIGFVLLAFAFAVFTLIGQLTGTRGFFPNP